MGEINQDPNRKSGAGLGDALDALRLSGPRRQVHPDPDRKLGKVEENLGFPPFLSRKFEDSNPSRILG